MTSGPVYPDSIILEAQLSAGVWTDLTPDWVGRLTVSYGIRGNGPLDRVASTGKMVFELNNSETNSAGQHGYYSPSSGYVRSGFTAGILVRLRITFEGESYIKFYGRVPPNGINVGPGLYGSRRVEVTALDFMEQCAIHTLYLPTLQQNKRMSEIAQLVIANMPVAPLATEYNQTDSIFPTVFDTVRSTTTALGELEKIAKSELGYIYVKRDRVYGETLVTNGRFYRSNNPDLTAIPLPASLCEMLLDESGNYLLAEDGSRLAMEGTFTAAIGKPIYGSADTTSALLTETNDALLTEEGDLLLLDEIAVADVRCPILESEINYGKYLANEIRYTTYPTYVDETATSVLFSLNSPIYIEAGGERTNLLGRYRDPNGGAARISGKDMVTPVASTDYLFNTAADGSGTNLTAYLQVTANYGTEGVNYTLKNTHSTLGGYVTRLNARGRGIYTYDPVTLMIEDGASKAIHGTRTLNLDLKYERDISTAYTFASIHLNQYMTPVTSIEKLKFCASRDAYAMATFLALEPGSKFNLYEQLAGASGDYFVNGIDIEIMPGNVIYCSLIPASAANDVYRFWYLGEVGKSELGVNTFLGF